MEANLKTETTLQWVQKWMGRGAKSTSGTFFGFVGQTVGEGWAVRNGSNLIYDAVFKQSMVQVSGFVSWVPGVSETSAAFAANAAVGAAVPYLTWAGSLAGGAAGFAAGYLATVVALKVTSAAMSGTFALARGVISVPSKIQALITTKPQSKNPAEIEAALEEGETSEEPVSKAPIELRGPAEIGENPEEEVVGEPGVINEEEEVEGDPEANNHKEPGNEIILLNNGELGLEEKGDPQE